ncbi:MAG TPA: glycosyltransferase family 39 protein [Pyrinomonadaceae bacterium]|nr:glycosyltransferase family 39 protein [Pyrinomonadaceae bacterium]
MHPSTLAKRVYLLLFIIVIAFYLYGLGQLPLLGPDEPRYAQIAREMLSNRDLITPTLGGHTWFEKPALLYWLIAGSFRVFGVSEWSARLGPAMCGVLTILAVWCVAREVDRSFGFWSLIVTASCLGLIVFSRAASFDVVITMTATWSLAFFLLHQLPTTKRKRLLLAGFYSFVGLSLLAKGLVGIVIPFGVVGFYFLLRLFSRKGAKVQRETESLPGAFLSAFAPLREILPSLLWGIPLALAVSAIWYGPVIARHGWIFIDEFFVQHHFARYVSNKYHHPQPIWFYPVIILMLALPWTVHLIAALAKVRSWNWRGEDSVSVVRVFSLAWLLLPIVFFSFSGSKLPGYIVPAVPAVALLVSDRLTTVRNSKWPLLIAGVTAASVLIVLHFAAAPYANRESVRDLLALADARGYANAPVLAQRSDDRSAEFYAHGRVIYGANGEPVTFDEVLVNQARAWGGRFVVFLPIEHAEKLRSANGIEIIGNNGKTAVVGWKP